LGDFVLNGRIEANGGNGGDNNTGNGTECGGAGGAGSGGSVWIQSPSVNIPTGTGDIDTSGGTGGTSAFPTCATNYSGGNGSRGMTRIDSIFGGHSITGTIGPGATVPTAPLAITYSGPSTPYTVRSKPIDFTASYVAFDQVAETTNACGTVGVDGALTVTYEGSQDGVNFEHPVSAANIAELSDYPYVRFTAVVTADTISPPCLTGITLSYHLRELTDPRLQGGLACGMIRNGTPTGLAGDLLCFGVAGAFARWRRRKSKK
jgi:hypothetical protein